MVPKSVKVKNEPNQPFLHRVSYTVMAAESMYFHYFFRNTEKHNLFLTCLFVGQLHGRARGSSCCILMYSEEWKLDAIGNGTKCPGNVLLLFTTVQGWK